MGIICPLVEIGFTDLPKSGGACNLPPVPSSLYFRFAYIIVNPILDSIGQPTTRLDCARHEGEKH